MRKQTILVGLNEINFEYIEKYNQKGLLPNFKKIFDAQGYCQTTSEDKYELWEPWVQWVTLHTGKTFEEHKIFRLGDIVDHPNVKQLWNVAEDKGLSVGAISPFNAVNNLKHPKFFVPDPWTKTKAAGSPLLQKVSTAVSQLVNDNAQEKVTKGSLVNLLKGFLSFVPITKWTSYLSAAAKVKKAGGKAIILDKILIDVFWNQQLKHKPDFSSIFLNSGAHIQHHYMFNAAVCESENSNPEWYCPKGQDPLLDILKVYDEFMGKLLSTGNQFYIATGLHQLPHKHITYYWRLNNHVNSLKELGITNYEEVLPRMSRDFLVRFRSTDEAAACEKLLESYKGSDGDTIFEIDNRGNSLFVELIYAKDITDDFTINSSLTNITSLLKPKVSFVAIKNGEHSGIGYFIDSTQKVATSKSIPLTETFTIISNSFSA